MNAPAPLPANTSTVASSTKPRRPKWLRFLRVLFALLLLALVALAEPHIFRFFLKQLISFEAYRRGGSVSIGQMEGSLWEPVALKNARWFFPFYRGSVLRLETDKVEGEFAWRELLPEGGGRWFRRLSVGGVRGKLELPSSTGGGSAQRDETRNSEWLPIPSRIEGHNIDLTVATDDEFVHLENASFMVSELEPGTIRVGQITVRQPWLSHTFRDVRGTTAVKESGSKEASVVVADLQLEEGLKISSLSANLAALRESRVDAEIQIDTFGGEIRAQARTLLDEKFSGIDANGTFRNIAIAPLANFLSVSDAAGGTIKDGKFTFRGSPRNLSRAAASLRLEAVHFQWESRQWDRLVLGASLLDRRVQIPELELHQGQNHLSLHGDMALPTGRTAWWKSEFSFNVAAKIENLTDLSALLLPEFKYAAGKMNIDGAVRGKSQQFFGALIVSGSDITWRNAPIEELHAALKITGNELQVANFELLNEDDFLRGRGVVNILGAKQYWGELRASVNDLATYAALLQPPIVPEPLAGGASVNWSGEGSAQGHSGKFQAHLRKLRTLGATGTHLHPLEADLEGVYSPGSMQFSRFGLSDDQSAFTANVTVGNRALSLQDIRLTHGADTWLEGSALLPLDVWRAWPNTALATLLTDGVAGKVNLTAHQLQLREASWLTGWKWPIEGVVDGTITAEGVLGALKTSGQVSLQNARLPLAWSDHALTDVSAKLSLNGQMLNVEEFTGKHRSGNYAVTGQIDFTNIRDTSLMLKLQSDGATIPAFQGIKLPVHAAGGSGVNAAPFSRDYLSATSQLDLHFEGPASAAQVTGTARLIRLDPGGLLNITQVWKGEPLGPLPPLFRAERTPWKAWKFNVDVNAQNASVELTAGALSADMQLTGTGAVPVLTGKLDLQDATMLAANGPVQIDEAIVVFRNMAPAWPSFELHASDELFGTGFTAEVYGTFAQTIRAFRGVPPLTDVMVRNYLTDPEPQADISASDSAPLSFSAPTKLTGNAPVYDWAPIIVEQPAAMPAAVQETTPPAPPLPIPTESAIPAAGTNL